MSIRILFCNIAWMRSYEGDPKNDPPRHGGSWVGEHGWAGEMLNFKPFRGQMYGFVEHKGRLDIRRLGAAEEDPEISGVLVVWLAHSDRRNETVIVGWFKNATVFATSQQAPAASQRVFKGEPVPYVVRARRQDAKLLPPDSRVFSVARRKKGFLGQANVWYANAPEVARFRERVREYISRDGQWPNRPNQTSRATRRARGSGWQVDVEKRQLAERKAIAEVSEYYSRCGYRIESVEKGRLGWDLNAIGHGEILRLEVKGVSGSDVVAELTPNEFAKMQMQQHRDTYRVCIVADALSKAPELCVFRYSVPREMWENETTGTVLNIERIEAARVRSER